MVFEVRWYDFHRMAETNFNNMFTKIIKMKKALCILFMSANIFVANAQTANPPKQKALTVCDVFTEMKAAGETNFMAFTKVDYVDGTSAYDAKHPVPGFDENKVQINTLIKMYYASGLKYYKTLDEATSAFNKIKPQIDVCFGDKGTDVKTEKRPAGNKWVSKHKDFLNNIYTIETTVGIFQNTKTQQWALEYLMIKK